MKLHIFWFLQLFTFAAVVNLLFNNYFVFYRLPVLLNFIYLDLISVFLILSQQNK